MIKAEQQASWIQQQLNQAQKALPGGDIDWLNDSRRQARQSLSRLPVLDRKLEAWRYTSVEALMNTPFVAVSDDPSIVERFNLEVLGLPATDAYRLVFINGRWVEHLSALDGLPEGVQVDSLRDRLVNDPQSLALWLGQVARHDTNVFTALNSALIEDGLYLHLDAGVILDKPVEVVHFCCADELPIAVQPRNLVVIDSGASATLVEYFVSEKQEQYFHNTIYEIVVGEKASLNHYRIQNEAKRAFHLSNLYLSQDADSHYQGVTLAFGGAWARTDYHTSFRRPGADCQLAGLYTVGDQQLTDFHLDVHHNVPGCTSREQFKGILYGNGRAVFDGYVLVEKDAQQSNAELTNDNMMLTRNAEIDTKPQLVIHADDVKCSHGTTVGQIEPEQIFYLRSRGIDAQQAYRMLSLGFAGEVIDTIQLEPVREFAYDTLKQTLSHAIEGR